MPQRLLLGIGAKLNILDISLQRFRYLDDIFGPQIVTLFSDQHIIEKSVIEANLVVDAVLIPGARASIWVDRDLVSRMKTGAVIRDVAVCSDPDIVQVSPEDAVKPDIASRPDLHIPNDHRIFCHKCRRVNLRIFFLKSYDHFYSLSFRGEGEISGGPVTC